uniref:Myosin X n=1 Tax=Neolamprologus brichardi TaxID=32507 RepID=A0A3Q4HUX6_NEOBR
MDFFHFLTQVYTYKQNTLTRQKVQPMHRSSIRGVEDMASLEDLHDGAIMHNLYLRYKQKYIYVTVNPYQPLAGLYDRPAVEMYSQHHLGEISPHIFAIANECYRSLWKRLQNQCVLISGESGAGKTESTKLILKFLSAMSQHSLEVSSRDKTSHVEEALLESSPIMEAFGNAKTVYNNNSSRFGKFVQLHVSQKGNIQGGKIVDYLLEKNRVVRQNPGERNYHIFYAILAGTNNQQREAFGLTHPDSYHYLRQSSCQDDKTIIDKGTFQDVLNAMRTMQFTEENINEILRLLAGILHTGNIEFVTAGGAQISSKSALSWTSELLGLNSDQVAEVLTHRSMILRGEEISTPLTVEQAVDSRDSMAMALYSQCFNWIIRKLNTRIKGKEDFKSVSILDIFGFENFEVNRFEQFNINYANEKLQEYFNKHIFSLEQLEYNKEGLVWADIDWMDNGECLDLIEKKLGLLALMNEESHFPKATDDTLLEKLHSQHSVFYFIFAFALRISHHTNSKYLLLLVRLDFVYDLFEHVLSRNKQDTLKSSIKHRRPTVSTQFKDSLHSLMATLSTSNPYFIRCIKPNTHKMPDHFDQTVVLNQLRYSGMLETVKIRRTGFPVRRTIQDFCSRYKVLMRGLLNSEDPRGCCVQLLCQYDSSSAEWQLGKTKVFLRESLEHRLEKQREVEVLKAAMIIQAYVTGYMARKQYKKLLRCIVVIQKNYRAFYWRRKFLLVRWAALTFQKCLRGQLARRTYSRMLEERRKKEEEERRRWMEEMERWATQFIHRVVTELESAESFVEASAEEEEAMRPHEASQVEEILRLEREIQVLQRQKERQELSLTEASLNRLQQLRDQELRRLEDEACKAAQQFLDSLNFDEIDECVRNIESSLGVGEEDEKKEDGQRRGNEEEEVDEGFGADDDAFKDSPNPSEHGHSDGQRTSGIRTSDDSSEEDPYANDAVIPSLPPTTVLHHSLPAMPSACRSASSSGDSAYCHPQASSEAQSDELVELIPPDEDSDYDQDDYDEGAIVSSGSMAFSNPRSGQWSPDYRGSVGTYNSSGAYRFSSEGAQSSFEDSEDDFERFDTDDELSYRRDSVYSCVTLPYFHSFLYIKGGLMNTWKRRWCVLKDETFLWFRTKQEALKQGWLHKKGGGSSTLSRRNWKRRWFVLRQSKLMYFENDGEEKMKGVLDMHNAKEIIDNTGKENGIDIVMPERTYHLIAESAEDARTWMLVNAMYSEVMKTWLWVCDRSRFVKPDLFNNYFPPGWLHKEMKNSTKASLKLKKRWFLLTHNSLDYYKSSERNALKLGTLVLNSLCSVVQPDEKVFKETGYWNVIVYGRKHSYRLYCKLLTEATRWANSVQNVIDTKAPIDTPTQQLIQDIKENCLNLEVVEQIYKRNPILRYSHHPLHSPLLPLPYGDIHLTSDRSYTTLQDEALKVFSSLQHLEGVADPVPIIQGILQTGQELKPLRDELYCQLIKQTTRPPQPGSPGNLCNWKILACMSCTFVVEKLIRGLAMEDSRNMFALFEHNDTTEKAIESRTVVADVLAKFEKLSASPDEGSTGWKFYFKLYCFLDTDNVPKDSVEFAFMFEQAHEAVIRGQYPAPEETLQFLAALRLQYLLGDHNFQSTIPEMSQVFPMSRLRARVQNSAKTFAPGTGSVADRSGTAERKRSSFLEGTLRRSFRSSSLSRQKLEEENSLEAWMREEAAAVRTSVMDKWKKLQGMNQEQAMVKYMALVKEWQGYGSTLFNVECRDGMFPSELWLGVSREAISVYKRGEPWPLEVFPYEQILSFGAPLSNTYKITVEGRELVFETQMVMDIAKLMKAYISMIVKKRYSNCQSVSSHGSHCSTW